MRKIVAYSWVILLPLLFLSGCNTGSKSPSVPQVVSTALLPTSERKSWEAEWEEVLSSARKEGWVILYASINPETRETLIKEFKNRFGIDLEIITGRGPQFIEKILAQRRAGLFAADIYLTGPTTAWATLKPKGALESIEKYLILPEVVDPGVWWGGKLLWMDQERTFIQFFAYPSDIGYINKDLVGPGEITSYKDLLNPKWKGKIILSDPLVGASGGNTLFFITEFAMGWDYIRALARQEPVILRDDRLMVEWVARSKYPVTLGVAEARFAMELRENGLPIEALLPKEGTYLTHGLGALTVLNQAPHPNASKVFLNWALAKEGQTILSLKELAQSARLDVPTGQLPAWKIRQAGVPYINMSTEELINKSYESRKPLAEVFGIK